MESGEKIDAPICPHCGGTAKQVDSIRVYRKSYGMIWICENYPECDSYVGCHGETGEPLGTLANAELRELRKRAHSVFDKLWKSGPYARGDAYAELAEKLGISKAECHIGMFDEAMCNKVIALYTR